MRVTFISIGRDGNILSCVGAEAVTGVCSAFHRPVTVLKYDCIGRE